MVTTGDDNSDHASDGNDGGEDDDGDETTPSQATAAGVISNIINIKSATISNPSNEPRAASQPASRDTGPPIRRLPKGGGGDEEGGGREGGRKEGRRERGRARRTAKINQQTGFRLRPRSASRSRGIGRNFSAMLLTIQTTFSTRGDK